LASALPQEKERRSTTPQTACDETQKRTGLSRAACVKEMGRQALSKPELPSAWSLRKGRGGPIKKISTQDHSCPNSIVNISGSPMKVSMPWLATAAMASKNRFEI
jgi:hypothetical protein